MSLRWTAYVAAKLPKGRSKTQSGRFPYKSGLLSKKVCYKVSLCEKFSGKVVTHSLAYLSVHKWLVGMSLPSWNFRPNWPPPPPSWKTPTSNPYSLLALPSTITPSEKVQLSVIGRPCTTGFLMNLRFTAYVASKPPPCSAVSLPSFLFLF